ncbi:hypothetical protein CEXT_741851 [Caerostris extrusa]|uniref:Uncharacterized protein n=1 Tax=Caerostris extrusa TaxID=172846 RepID=A0AAV4VGG3_CAEEX|nr:hypothetical protein CEXT_741851 [Caerostris extrusa]
MPGKQCQFFSQQEPTSQEKDENGHNRSAPADLIGCCLQTLVDSEMDVFVGIAFAAGMICETFEILKMLANPCSVIVDRE